jgi:hypothetical protein
LMSSGSLGLAELFPFVQGLWYYEQVRQKEKRTKEPCRILLVSDSESTVRSGNGAYGRWANGCLWASIAFFEQAPYTLRWQHIRRLSRTAGTVGWTCWPGSPGCGPRSCAGCVDPSVLAPRRGRQETRWPAGEQVSDECLDRRLRPFPMCAAVAQAETNACSCSSWICMPTSAWRPPNRITVG